jgi:glycosyltransferase involved in cell wall biosynthesis
MPLVSIGMPIFNDKKFIRKAIDSLLAQTIADFELILADDCSFDGSAEICQAYARQDARIKYIRHPRNIGISKNMEFLLREAVGKYFMWAANDDIWGPGFLETLVAGLERDPDAVTAFTPMCFIDEEDRVIEKYPARHTDYSGNTPLIRLQKLIDIFDDGFGYALFRREMILDVQFPVWWWINKKCAYNNIYPTLCFYLTKGNYLLCGDRVQWFNRLKAEANVNHKVPFPTNYIRGAFAFSLRKFNLFWASVREIKRAGGGMRLMMNISPKMFYKWFLKPSLVNFILRSKDWRKGDLTFF